MARSRLNLPSAPWLRGLMACVLLVGAVTGMVALLKPYVPVLNLLVLYLLAVLPVAVVWGARLAAITSVVGVMAFAFLLPHQTSIWTADSRNLVALGVFLVTSLLVAELAARSRRAAVESERLTEEQSALRRVATLVAESDAPAAVFEAVTREVGLLCGADLARMERYEEDGTVTGVGAWSSVTAQLTVGTRIELDGLSVASEVLKTCRPIRVDSFAGATGEIAEEARALGIRSSVGCPIVVAGQVWGVIAASTKSDEPFAANTESQIASFTELVATAIENAEARTELRRMADEQAALRRVATLVARGAAPEAVFNLVAQELSQLAHADITAIFRFETDGTATMVGSRGVRADEMSVGERGKLESSSAIGTVQATGASARYDVDDVLRPHLPAFLRELGVLSAVASPIIVEGRCWGGLSIASRRGAFPPTTEQRMVDFTEIVGTAIANAESRAQLTASRARVVAAGDEMRRRVERDLHDGAQQRLVSLALVLRLAQAGVPAYLPNLRADIGNAAEELTEVVDELRELARGIHPSVLVESGLGPALRTLTGRSAIPVDLKIGTSSRYPAPLEVATYYVVSEALTNVAKHAHASRAAVSLEERDDALRLTVRDDGTGGAEASGGSGLVGLHDRVESLGGSILVISPVGHGTAIYVSLPLDRAAEHHRT
ncbi:GAF domain-containing protein [Kribbella sp. NPDC055110]